MSTPTWQGIFPSLPTPFDDEDRIDLPAMRRLVEFAIDAGAHGLVCLGLAGEVGRLSGAEREALTSTIVEASAGRRPVLVGVTGESQSASVALARQATRAGADGLVVPPPVGYKLTARELVSFLATVAAATDLPVLVQDAPEYLDVVVGPEAVLAAAESAPNIVGVKLETGAEGIEEWRTALGERFVLFGGNGGIHLLDCLRAGAQGVMPGLDTVDLQTEIAEAEEQGRPEEADEAFARLLPMLVYELQTIDLYNACAKYVLNKRGVLEGVSLRAPGPGGLSERSQARLQRHIDRLGLLQPVAADA